MYQRRRIKGRGSMNKWIVAVLALSVCAGIVYAADEGAKAQKANIGEETVAAVTDTAQSAVSGTANVAQTAVSDTVEAPKTAIQAVKDTANTALTGADSAIKTFTGEDK
jgi:hypothetical protein